MNRRQMRDEIVGALAGYHAAALAEMGVAWRLPADRLTGKSDLLRLLADRICQGTGLADQLARLTLGQREALSFVARHPNGVALRLVNEVLKNNSQAGEAIDKQLIQLLELGLLLYVPTYRGWKLDFSAHDPTFALRHVFLPRAIAPTFEGQGRWAELIATAPEPAQVQGADPSQLLRGIFLLLRSVTARPARLTQQHFLHMADMRRLVLEVHPHVEAKQWHTVSSETNLILDLALHAGLVKHQGQTLATFDRGEGFTAASQPQQLSLLYQAWLQVTWHELRRVPGLVIDPYHVINTVDHSGYTNPELIQARQIMLQALAEVADGQWRSVADLAWAIRTREPGFLLGDSLSGYRVWPGSAGMREPEHYQGIRRNLPDHQYNESLITRATGWNEVEGAFIRQVLIEPLRWLGIVDIGLTAHGVLESFRLTALGSALLTGTPAAIEARASGPRLVVQPNYEVIVLDVAGSLDLMTWLDKVAAPRGADRAAIYQLTREALLPALQGGLTLAEIIDRLEREAATPLPQNVRFALEDWARQFERVTLHFGIGLLEADTAEQLDQWLSDARLSPYLQRRLSATVVTVAAASLDVVAHLIGPAVTVRQEETTHPPIGSITSQPAGRFTIASPALGRFERHRLDGFADQISATAQTVVYQITAASAERARAAGWTAPLVMSRLAARLRGAPSPALTLAVRGWLGDLPPAQQATLRAVQLPEAAIWAVLADQPPAPGLIVRVAPTLALVDDSGLARLGEALRAYGLTIVSALPEAVVAALPVLAPTSTGPVGGSERQLQTLRGKPLRDFFKGAIHKQNHVIILHQQANQKSPRHHTVQPMALEHRYSGWSVTAETETGTIRNFKLDDIFGVALEEEQ